MNYNCPHCGKSNLHTFCDHCGKPTESIQKYRIMYLGGLIFLPLITYLVINEIQDLIPLINTSIPDVFQIILVLPLFMLGYSLYHIIKIWFKIELAFKIYYKKLDGS